MASNSPDLYSEVSRILHCVSQKQQSVRNMVFSSYFPNKKQLLRLSCEILKYHDVLESIVQENQELIKLASEVGEDGWPLYIGLFELLFGSSRDFAKFTDQRLRRSMNKLNHLIMASKNRLVDEGVLGKDGKISEESLAASKSGKSLIKVPRYARINTVLIEAGEAIKALCEHGWKYLETDTSGFSRKRFRNLIVNLPSNQFCFDKDIPNLLVFPHGSDLHQNYLVENGSLLLQDKASCLSSLCLNPEPGSSVLDSCAAPGMKTTHLADFMENRGKLLAMDKVPERAETLSSVLYNAGVTCATVECADFLRANLSEKRFSKIRFALVDPPCSGSGIVSRMDHLTDSPDSKNSKRLNGLGNLQAMLLKHAMKLPGLERIVYSTCSVYERENETVIDEVLSDEVLGGQFQLINAFPKWKHRGRKSYSFGRKVLRSSPEKDLTNGFFVAVFEKIN